MKSGTNVKSETAQVKEHGELQTAHAITIAFATEHPMQPSIFGQPKQYLIPSLGPLWTNPLNDF